MPRYYITISGSAWAVEGNTPEAAIQYIRNHADAYCSFHAKEIGKDVDELGYPMKVLQSQGESECVVISVDRPVEYGTLDGNTIKVRG